MGEMRHYASEVLRSTCFAFESNVRDLLQPRAEYGDSRVEPSL